VTTPLDIKLGWLFCLEFNETIKQVLSTELSWVYLVY